MTTVALGGRHQSLHQLYNPGEHDLAVRFENARDLQTLKGIRRIEATLIVPARGVLDVAKRLNVTPEQADAIARRSPEVRMRLKRAELVPSAPATEAEPPVKSPEAEHAAMSEDMARPMIVAVHPVVVTTTDPEELRKAAEAAKAAGAELQATIEAAVAAPGPTIDALPTSMDTPAPVTPAPDAAPEGDSKS